MPSNTRERLVEAAVQRFYRDGFRNVGVDQIIDDVGISKTAFYKHFRCKEDLMLAVLQRESTRLKAELRDMLRELGGRSARDQLHALVGVVEQVMAKGDFHGCIFINAAFEFPLAHDPTHKAAADNKNVFSDIIFEIAEGAGASDPARLTEELCMVVDGAYIAQQVTNDSSQLSTARRLADKIIAEYLPAEPPHRGHSSTSTAKTRRRSSAQASRRGRRAGSSDAGEGQPPAASSAAPPRTGRDTLCQTLPRRARSGATGSVPGAPRPAF